MNLTAGGIVWVRDKVLAAVPCSKSHSIILQRLRLQISLDYYTIPPATQASTCTLAGIFFGYIISTQNKHFIHRLTSPVSKQCIHEFPIALTLILLLSTGQPESPSPFVSGLFFGGRPVLIKRYMIPLFFPLSPHPPLLFQSDTHATMGRRDTNRIFKTTFKTESSKYLYIICNGANTTK